MAEALPRSLHFLEMVTFVGFLLFHAAIVVLHGFGKEMNKGHCAV